MGRLRESTRIKVLREQVVTTLSQEGDVFLRHRHRRLSVKNEVGGPEPPARRTPIEWWSSGSPKGMSPSFADHLW